MSGYTINNRRIARNTFFLYVRMILVTLINLYTVRIVLEVLGVEDYGIYNVVAGIVTSLSFLTSVLSSATQRYYSFSIGESRPEKLTEVFNVSLTCYLCIALIVVILGETVGLWIIKTQLTIPVGRMSAAIFAYQFSILSFVLSMIQVPFSSLTIAKEDINIWSIVSVAETAFKLIFALLLLHIPIDHMISYGASLSITWFMAFISYVIICRIKYPEICVLNFKLYNRQLFKEMISFSGWTMYGSLAGVGLNQGITILINIFFGPLVNAARAVGIQINSAIGQFCNSFTTAIKPPIVKCYATDDKSKILQIFYLSNKVLYFSALILCLPLILEMEYILTIWLKNVTDYMIVFSIYSIVFAVLLALHQPITIIIEATGDIRNYRVIVESFTLLAMPLTWIVYKFGGTPESTYIVILIVFTIAQIVRVKMLSNKMPKITIGQYIKKFAIPATIVTIITLAVLLAVKQLMPSGFLRLLVIFLLSVILVVSLVFGIALSKKEKEICFNLLRNSKKNI